MTKKKFNSKISPQQDAGWGLIYRLNDLWAKVDRAANAGKLNDWNFLLDSIWRNLLYRNSVKITKDNDKITNIELETEDRQIYDVLNEKIKRAKRKMAGAKKEDPINYKDLSLARREHYDALQLKDIWLRKFMQELGLYLKEIEWDASKAIYGGYVK